MESKKTLKKICKNCKYAYIMQKVVICTKRTNHKKGGVFLTQEDSNCRNYFEPKEDN